MKIVIVDDNKESLYLLETLLEGNGYEVVATTNGVEALEKLRAEGLDMIVADILMPVMDGFQVLDLIRQRSNVPIIMLTARREVTTLRDALALGADDYVRKPFATRELMARVRAKLRRTTPEVLQHRNAPGLKCKDCGDRRLN